MSKQEYENCIYTEVYLPYENSARRKLTVIDRFRCKFLSPQLNAAYLVRGMQYWHSQGGAKRFFSSFIHIKLARRYGLYISPKAVIGKGLKMCHPTSIVITNATIGENLTIFQNCTIGQKYAGKAGYDKVPHIGNNVTMYAGSSIIGDVKVADNVVLAAHSCLVSDALIAGIYAGCPAKLIKKL